MTSADGTAQRDSEADEALSTAAPLMSAKGTSTPVKGNGEAGHRRNRSAAGSEAFLTGLSGVLTPSKGSGVPG
jgi:hypothetical protein